MAHVGQNLSLIGGDAGRGKRASVFRLCHAVTDDGDASAVGRDVVASCDTAGAGSGEVGGVRVKP